MLEMDHLVNMGFPIFRDDFPMIQWELYRFWRSCVEEEIETRQQILEQENKNRAKVGQKLKARDLY